MYRIWNIGTLMLVLGALATSAAADDADRPLTAGRKGTITAWTEAGDAVVAHKICPRQGAVWDYVACGKALRERLTIEVCAARGPGSHKYLYQVGDGRKSPSSVFCKK